MVLPFLCQVERLLCLGVSGLDRTLQREGVEVMDIWGEGEGGRSEGGRL